MKGTYAGIDGCVRARAWRPGLPDWQRDLKTLFPGNGWSEGWLAAFSRGWDAFVNTLGRALVRGSTITRLIAWSLENLKSRLRSLCPTLLKWFRQRIVATLLLLSSCVEAARENNRFLITSRVGTIFFPPHPNLGERQVCGLGTSEGIIMGSFIA